MSAMSRLSRLLLPVLLVVASFSTHADVPPQPAASKHIPLLWKVSDQDNSVYLLGSFHMLKPDDYPLSPDVDAAFADSSSLVFEVAPSDLLSPETAVKFQQAAGYSDGKTLSQVLPEDVKARLEQLLSATGGSLAQVEASEPWAVSLGMILGLAQAAGFRQEQGLDMHFIRLAGESGKPVAGLESVDDQIAALDGSPHAEQAFSLGKLLENPQKAITDLLELHDAWKTGDVQKLNEEMRVKMQQETPESYRLINTARNDAWVPGIERYLTDSDNDNALIVVGALHLLGEDGVVEKLRAKGYAVERVCSACEIE